MSDHDFYFSRVLWETGGDAHVGGENIDPFDSGTRRRIDLHPCHELDGPPWGHTRPSGVPYRTPRKVLGRGLRRAVRIEDASAVGL